MTAFVTRLSRPAVLARDPVGPPPIRSVDPGDDYLLAPAGDFPIRAPAKYLSLLTNATTR